jgi:hypothetical protein
MLSRRSLFRDCSPTINEVELQGKAVSERSAAAAGLYERSVVFAAEGSLTMKCTLCGLHFICHHISSGALFPMPLIPRNDSSSVVAKTSVDYCNN